MKRLRRRINGNPGGIIASVLQPPQAVEEDLKDEASVTRDVVVEVSEDPTHCCKIPIGC